MENLDSERDMDEQIASLLHKDAVNGGVPDDDVVADDDGPKRKGRKRGPKAKGQVEPPREPVEEQELTEAEVATRDLLDRELPRPTENVKSLGLMMAKYHIGSTPDFKAQVWRTYPKMFPGGVKADGFYDTWDQPLTEELLQAEYGGGTYSIRVIGPHPTEPNGTKQYDSLQVQLGGETNYTRMPRAAKTSAPAETGPQLSPLPMLTQENTKLSEVAMKMVGDIAVREREERHRVEDRMEERTAATRSALEPVIEAERRRADDVVKAEREKGDMERKFHNERFEEERREREEMRRRLEEMSNRPGPSVADEIAKLSSLGMFGRNDDGMAKTMLEKVLDKHREEMESLSRQHVSFVESIRSSHASEVQVMRQAHQRELESERDAGKGRDLRFEERLTAEREERRRDQDRHRESLDTREQHWRNQLETREMHWKDQLANQQTSTNQNWESRHSTVVTNLETRISWLQQEIDRLKSDLTEARQLQKDQGDPIAQIEKYTELKKTLGDAFGIENKPPAPAGGGIGISGGMEDWKMALVEGGVDRLPQIIEAVGGWIKGNQGSQPAAPQQQYQPGQVVQTPQGEMIVVQTPQGLMFAPREQVEREQRRGGGMGRMLPDGNPKRPRTSGGPAKKKRTAAVEKKVSVTPNLAEGLPKRRAPWEGGGEEPNEEDETPQAPVLVQRPAPPPPESDEPQELSSMERQGLQMIAVQVHESSMAADEPDEFADKMMAKFPENILKQIVGRYTTDQIVRGVKQVQPQSAGATPAGQQFIREAFRILRAKLSE